MIQLAGHLKGRALQEWNLIHPDQRTTFAQATEALCLRLDTASKTIAAQEFRHTAQREAETISDFIHRLECTFRTAYGRDAMSVETRDTLLYGQMQEGLCLRLMRGPAVSRAGTYQEVCIVARNEEKRPCRPEEEARVLSALHWYHTTFTMPTPDHAVCWLF